MPTATYSIWRSKIFPLWVVKRIENIFFPALKLPFELLGSHLQSCLRTRFDSIRIEPMLGSSSTASCWTKDFMSKVYTWPACLITPGERHQSYSMSSANLTRRFLKLECSHGSWEWRGGDSNCRPFATSRFVVFNMLASSFVQQKL